MNSALSYLLIITSAKISKAKQLFLVITVSILPWTFMMQLPDGRLHIYFMDVGQGDGIFIQTPQGKQLLIDTGSKGAAMHQVSQLMPVLDKTIEAIFISHPQEDHMGGLEEILAHYQSEILFINIPIWYQSKMQTDINRVGPSAKALYQGDLLEIEEGLTIEVLWPKRELEGFGEFDINYNSQILHLRYREFSILFTGDAEMGEDALFDYGIIWPDIDILKVPHHGSNNGVTVEFLNQTTPALGIIQVGPNTFGHPNSSVLTLLEEHNVVVLRNDEDGVIEIISNGVGFEYTQTKLNRY